MKKFIIGAALFAALFLAPQSRADNNNIFPTGPVYQLSGLIWGTTGTAFGFNNNFFFAPLNINENVCVFVYNNNPTNSHTFTASIVLTGNPNAKTPSDGSWQATATSSGLLAAISPGQPGGIGGSVSGASQVSINLSGGTTQAGSPDTANVIIVQSTGNCFAGNQMISSAPNTVSSVLPIQAVSEGLSQAFFTSVAQTNPTSGADLSNVFNAATNSRTLFFDKAFITCTVACTVNIEQSSAAGATCSTSSPLNMKGGSSVASLATGTFSCTTPPTQIAGSLIAVALSAGSIFVVDLRGFIAPPGTGIFASNGTTITGGMNIEFLWYEK